MKSAAGLLIFLILGGSLIVMGQKDADKGSGTPAAKGADKKADKDQPKTAPVTIAGKPFTLELAIDQKVQFKGLGDRTEIKPDGGMLFVFSKPEARAFVMRDCPIPIDIIYLDGSGRVVATYKMTPEPPRSEAEKKLSLPYPSAPEWAAMNNDYEDRLKKYPSGFAAQFVIELKGNTLDTLNVKKGDKIDFDIEGLKKLAK
ncbi:MAG: hypothetical protein GC200_04910 [Tepidisphaera sp.]|nr:hypothetical protein [Tepidisphaera sp.]